MNVLRWIVACLVVVASLSEAVAAGPRWVAGSQWAADSNPVGWYRSDVQYFVDAGPLSASVDNPTATALVDAAAAVWNVQGIPFTLTNGGSLAEDVSSNNVSLGSNGPGVACRCGRLKLHRKADRGGLRRRRLHHRHAARFRRERPRQLQAERGH